MKPLRQLTNVVLMIRPSRFRCNEQTSVNNYFQNASSTGGLDEITIAAKAEFDSFTNILTANGVTVLTVQDDDSFDTPDSVFPNNWISFHQSTADGDSKGSNALEVNIYPMFAVNRRHEKNLLSTISQTIRTDLGVGLQVVNDFSMFQDSDKFLEGTGSMVLDRTHSIAYCALSPRAHPDVLDKFCARMNCTSVSFTAFQTLHQDRVPIYHTNVMMCIGDSFAIICMDCIDDEGERLAVENSLISTGKDIISITEEQVGHFAGNMLQVLTKDGDSKLVMSSEAFSILTDEQKARIEMHCPILHAPLPVIEENGGGSARCMMAEVFV